MRRIDIPESTVRKLYADGKTQAEIAVVLGCSKGAVGNRMRAWGMPVRLSLSDDWLAAFECCR